jgi:hypothetical protein
MYHCLASTIAHLFFIRLPFDIVLYRAFWYSEGSFYGVVGYEEEGCAGGGTNDCAADAPVYAVEASAGGKAGAGLEARF